jgi:dTDP-4-dehydrorhamnose 3,5-epimerase
LTFTEAPLKGAYVIDLAPIRDERGYFVRTFCEQMLAHRGLVDSFVQANQSLCRKRGTIRGLHYQVPPVSEAKLVRCLRGAAFDVLVDMRRYSPTLLKWFSCELSAENFKMVYVPPGFAHGYQALTDGCEVAYQASKEYTPEKESRVRFDDPRVMIRWPIKSVIVSPKDAATPDLTGDFSGIDL